MENKQPEPEAIQVKKTDPIKFKDKPGRGGVVINFMRDFGYIPEYIVIQKIRGRNNTIQVSAPLSKVIKKAVKKAIKQVKKGVKK